MVRRWQTDFYVASMEELCGKADGSDKGLKFPDFAGIDFIKYLYHQEI
jgi:hypothetical protein